MKTTHKTISTILLMACSLYSGINWAHGGGGHGGYRGGGHGHSHFGFYFGAPFYSYPYYAYPYQSPYYYPPAVVTAPATPPVYIQQSPSAQQYPSGYWYYCSNPDGYYPYVKECPQGWQQVEPIPSSPR